MKIVVEHDMLVFFRLPHHKLVYELKQLADNGGNNNNSNSNSISNK